LELLKKMRGDRAELPPRSSCKETFAVALVAVTVIGGLTLLSSTLEVALLLGTFAASSLLVFAYPDVPFSQPRNILLGHLIGSACGPSR
jgi:CBS-domain-containing membrane protein